jgi:hypothetical protein
MYRAFPDRQDKSLPEIEMAGDPCKSIPAGMK